MNYSVLLLPVSRSRISDIWGMFIKETTRVHSAQDSPILTIGDADRDITEVDVRLKIRYWILRVAMLDYNRRKLLDIRAPSESSS